MVFSHFWSRLNICPNNYAQICLPNNITLLAFYIYYIYVSSNPRVLGLTPKYAIYTKPKGQNSGQDRFNLYSCLIRIMFKKTCSLDFIKTMNIFTNIYGINSIETSKITTLDILELEEGQLLYRLTLSVPCFL